MLRSLGPAQRRPCPCRASRPASALSRSLLPPSQPPAGCGLAFQQLVESLLPEGEMWAPLRESALAAMQQHAGVKVQRSHAWAEAVAHPGWLCARRD